MVPSTRTASGPSTSNEPRDVDGRSRRRGHDYRRLSALPSRATNNARDAETPSAAAPASAFSKRSGASSANSRDAVTSPELSAAAGLEAQFVRRHRNDFRTGDAGARGEHEPLAGDVHGAPVVRSASAQQQAGGFPTFENAGVHTHGVDGRGASRGTNHEIRRRDIDRRTAALRVGGGEHAAGEARRSVSRRATAARHHRARPGRVASSKVEARASW